VAGVTERFIVRDTTGRWIVRTAERFVSSYDRKSDALARAITGLRQAGGGHWIVQDAKGQELDRGEVSSVDARLSQAAS
jgi:hypothetical protein